MADEDQGVSEDEGLGEDQSAGESDAPSDKSPVSKGTATKGGLVCPEWDTESDINIPCKGRRRKKKKKKKKAEAWPSVPVQYNPCPHLHFKFETLNRNGLTKQQHMDLLATPKGYVWEPDKELRYIRKGKTIRGRRRKKGLKQGAKKTGKKDKQYIGHFLCEIWNSLPPKMVDQLHQLLVEEFGMTEEEAEAFIKQQKECAQSKGDSKKKKTFCPPTLKVGVRHKWVKEFSRIFASKVTDYVVMLLSSKRTPRVRKLAAAILKHFCDITGEKTTLNTPKTKLQRLLVFISDRLAVWLDSLIKETCEKDIKDVAVEAKMEPEPRPSKERKPQVIEEEEEVEEEESKPPSKPPSKPSSKPTSGEGSKEGSKPPSKPSSKEPSKPSSKEPSQTPSKQKVEEEAAPEEAAPEEAPVAPEEEAAPEEADKGVEEEAEEETAVIEEEVVGEEAGEEQEEEIEEEEEELAEEFIEEEEEEEAEEEISEESEVSVESLPMVPPMALRDKGVVYQITRGDGSFYNVRQLSSGTVADKVADVRQRERPARIEKKELTDSPLKLETMKDWADWAARATAIAEEWTRWIDATVNAAETSTKMRKGKVPDVTCEPLRPADWRDWQAKVRLESDKIAKKRKDLKEEGEVWKTKTEKAAQSLGPEKETKVTDLSAADEEAAPAAAAEGEAPAEEAPADEGEAPEGGE